MSTSTILKPKSISSNHVHRDEEQKPLEPPSDLHFVRKYIESAMPHVEHEPQGRILYPWISVTSSAHYASTLFTWDMYFSSLRFAIAGRPEYLRHLVDNLLSYQQSDGHTPSVIHIERGPRFTDPPYHAQPFVLQAALIYVHETGDTEWGDTVFEKLIKYLDYYDRNYTAAFGIKRWINAWMGGMDNEAVNCFVPMGTVASCDINAYYYLEVSSAAKLARLLKRESEAEILARRAKRHCDIVNDKLWYESVSSYSALNLPEGRPFFRLDFDDLPLHVGEFAFQSCSNLMPLMARMAPRDSGRAMIEKYVINEAHFWSPWGVRSLSKSSEYYNNAVFGNPMRFADARRMTESNSQGPVWVLVSHFTFHALRHYGYAAEARELADRTVAVLANSLRIQESFPENFDAETGRPLYATHYASWNYLGDTMHEALESGKSILDPILDD